MAAPEIEISDQATGPLVRARGAWTLAGAQRARALLSGLKVPPGAHVRLDLSGLDALDTVGALLICQARDRLSAAGAELEIAGLTESHSGLFGRVAGLANVAPMKPARVAFLTRLLEGLGRATVSLLLEARDLLGFFGMVVVGALNALLHPSRLRITALVSHIQEVGTTALPIVGLLNFLVGIVLAFQGVDQLRQFGAEIFTVNLVGVASLREMGILITAIVVAGRSGSAFTAEIGAMKVNEEVDAMQTIGLDPIEVLVLPRVFALMIALPLLTFYADVVAILGGALMSVTLIGLSPQQFIHQLSDAVDAKTFFVGIVKAPVFAAIIAMVGCFQGLRVTGSAESVGRLTTQSVVESIFLVIVLDAAFSVFFSLLKI